MTISPCQWMILYHLVAFKFVSSWIVLNRRVYHGQTVLLETASADIEQAQLQTQFWKNRIQQLQKDAHLQRQEHRYQRNRNLLEDRARYLALRALRTQTRFQQLVLQPMQNSTTTLPLSVLKPKWPAPSLSSSATRNYIRKEDTLLSDTQRKLEQKLYGKRFKHAWKVYIRLLEALEEVRNHGKQQGAELVRLRERHQAILLNTSYTTHVDADSQESTESLFVVHKNNHDRMKQLIRLALYGDEYFFFPPVSSTVILQDPLTPTRIHVQRKIDPTLLKHVATEDLIRAIKIRGNLPRKGSRFPKKREKVLEYFEQSYNFALFI